MLVCLSKHNFAYKTSNLEVLRTQSIREQGHIKGRVKPDQLVVEIQESKAKEGREEVRSQRLLNTGGARLGKVM